MRTNRAILAIDVFLQNLKDFELVNSRNVLILKSKLALNSENVADSIVIETELSRKENGLPMRIGNSDFIQEAITAESNKKVPIYLTKDKIAYFLYPNEITANDIAIVKHQLEGILLRIQLDNEEKSKLNSEA